MMVCTSVRKSSGPCVCFLVLQRLRHLASFCVLLSCFVCRGIPCICSCNAIQFLLQLSRSLGSQLENGLTSSSRLDSSTVDKMPNFWQDGVCSCKLVAYHGFFFVRTILLGYCHDLVHELPVPGFVLSACAVWIASLTLFNSASFSVSLHGKTCHDIIVSYVLLESNVDHVEIQTLRIILSILGAKCGAC